MTVGELHEILDDENKRISLAEYQEVLYQLKNDTIAFATREELEKQEVTPKCNFYEGETNAFQIALDLSEHINPNPKAIECLKEVKENFCSGKMIFFADCGLSKKEKDLILDHEEEDKRILADLIDTKIKELEGESND